MSDGDRYEADRNLGGVFDKGVWDKRTQRYISNDAPRSPVPDYRHAQKESMRRGDSGTYFMRKTANRVKRSSKRS